MKNLQEMKLGDIVMYNDNWGTSWRCVFIRQTEVACEIMNLKTGKMMLVSFSSLTKLDEYDRLIK